MSQKYPKFFFEDHIRLVLKEPFIFSCISEIIGDIQDIGIVDAILREGLDESGVSEVKYFPICFINRLRVIRLLELRGSL